MGNSEKKEFYFDLPTRLPDNKLEFPTTIYCISLLYFCKYYTYILSKKFFKKNPDLNTLNSVKQHATSEHNYSSWLAATF